MSSCDPTDRNPPAKAPAGQKTPGGATRANHRPRGAGLPERIITVGFSGRCSLIWDWRFEISRRLLWVRAIQPIEIRRQKPRRAKDAQRGYQSKPTPQGSVAVRAGSRDKGFGSRRLPAVTAGLRTLAKRALVASPRFFAGGAFVCGLEEIYSPTTIMEKTLRQEIRPATLAQRGYQSSTVSYLPI